jgi:hypothetical protein
MTNSFGPRGRSRRSDEEIIPWLEKWKAAHEARKRQMQNSLAIRLRRRVTIQSTQGASRNMSVRGAGRQSVEKTEELSTREWISTLAFYALRINFSDIEMTKTMKDGKKTMSVASFSAAC